MYIPNNIRQAEQEERRRPALKRKTEESRSNVDNDLVLLTIQWPTVVPVYDQLQKCLELQMTRFIGRTFLLHRITSYFFVPQQHKRVKNKTRTKKNQVMPNTSLRMSGSFGHQACNNNAAHDKTGDISKAISRTGSDGAFIAQAQVGAVRQGKCGAIVYTNSKKDRLPPMT